MTVESRERHIEERSPEQRSTPISRAEYYHVVNAQINHQDDLVNQRVVWLVVSEAFFFIAYVTLLNAPDSPTPIQKHERDLLYWVIPIAGLLAGVFTYVAVLTSMVHIGQLNNWFSRYLERTPEHDRSVQSFPPIQGSAAVRHLAKVTPICLPLVFILTWMVIMVW